MYVKLEYNLILKVSLIRILQQILFRNIRIQYLQSCDIGYYIKNPGYYSTGFQLLQYSISKASNDAFENNFLKSDVSLIQLNV